MLKHFGKIHKFNKKNYTKVPVSNFDKNYFINYEKLVENCKIVKKKLNRNLTYSEKILYGHLTNPETQEINSNSYLDISPDRIAMQDASAQSILHFLNSSCNFTIFINKHKKNKSSS
jgi:aconitate hydratase